MPLYPEGLLNAIYKLGVLSKSHKMVSDKLKAAYSLVPEEIVKSNELVEWQKLRLDPPSEGIGEQSVIRAYVSRLYHSVVTGEYRGARSQEESDKLNDKNTPDGRYYAWLRRIESDKNMFQQYFLNPVYALSVKEKESKTSLLNLACAYGNMSGLSAQSKTLDVIIDILDQHRQNINEFDSYSRDVVFNSGFKLAAKRGDTRVLEYLFKTQKVGEQMLKGAFLVAAKSGSIDTVKWFFEQAKDNAQLNDFYMACTDTAGNNVLAYAAASGNTALCDYFWQKAGSDEQRKRWFISPNYNKSQQYNLNHKFSGIETVTYTPFTLAATDNQPSTLAWCWQKALEMNVGEAMLQSQFNYIEVSNFVDFLGEPEPHHEEKSLLTFNAFAKAIKNASVDAMEFIWDKLQDNEKRNAMLEKCKASFDVAFYYGHVQVLAWLWDKLADVTNADQVKNDLLDKFKRQIVTTGIFVNDNVASLKWFIDHFSGGIDLIFKKFSTSEILIDIIFKEQSIKCLGFILGLTIPREHDDDKTRQIKESQFKNIVYWHDYALITLAAKKGYLNIIEQFKKNVDIPTFKAFLKKGGFDKQNNNYQPLQLAARYGYTTTLKQLWEWVCLFDLKQDFLANYQKDLVISAVQGGYLGIMDWVWEKVITAEGKATIFDPNQSRETHHLIAECGMHQLDWLLDKADDTQRQQFLVGYLEYFSHADRSESKLLDWLWDNADEADIDTILLQNDFGFFHNTAKTQNLARTQSLWCKIAAKLDNTGLIEFIESCERHETFKQVPYHVLEKYRLQEQLAPQITLTR